MPEPGPDEPVLPATVSSDKAASPQGEVAAMPGEAGGVALPTALTPDASEGSPREGCERYELLELLGSGGMGEVHKARVAVNCAAIPQGIAERLLFGSRRGAYSGAEDAEGYLQAAHGGTLFLDEVVELELAVQAKLLRALETREVFPLGGAKAKQVDILVCSASNKDLRALVAGGRLREDLYFRIGRPQVTLAPLRQRPEELPLLLQRAVRQLSSELSLHSTLVEACLLRPWPGNVRELLVEARSAAQTALMQSAQRVEARHLSPSAGTAFGPASPPAAMVEPRPASSEESSRARPLAGHR